MAVHDRRQVPPLTADLEIGDVGHPDLVEAVDHHLVGPALHAGQELGQSGPLAVEAGRPRADAVLAHQSLYPAPAHDLTALLQGRVDSRAAIGFAAVRVRRSDLVHEASVLNRTLARWPVHPGVVARGADPEHPAHRCHRVRFLVVLDEGEDVAFRAEVNAMAFFKRSCSSFRRSYCFLTWRSSLSSAATAGSTSTPLAMICPSRANLRQRDNMKGWM